MVSASSAEGSRSYSTCARSEHNDAVGLSMAAPDLLAQHGVALLFAWAFAVQAGVPAPAVPILVGAGALSCSGHMELALAVEAATAAALGAEMDGSFTNTERMLQ